jgi:hypothetical protein
MCVCVIKHWAHRIRSVERSPVVYQRLSGALMASGAGVVKSRHATLRQSSQKPTQEGMRYVMFEDAVNSIDGANHMIYSKQTSMGGRMVF